MTLKETVDLRKTRASETVPEEGSNGHGFEWLAWPGRIAILVAVVIAPWMIGSVGLQAQWILAVLMAVATGSWWLTLVLSSDRQPVLPWIALFMSGGVLLGLLQIAPLPDAVAESLLGKQLLIAREWSAAALLGKAVTPRISLDADATWRQTLLLLVCIAGLASTSGLFRRTSDLVTLWTTCCINGGALAFFGIIHKLTSNGKLFWQLELTQGGQPFASFVNRNNASGFLLLCLAASVALVNWLWTRDRMGGPAEMISREIPFWRQISTWFQIQLAELSAAKLAVLILTVLIGAGVMASLSRGGVIALFGGSIFALLYYGMARRPQAGGMIVFPLLVAVILLTSWIGFYDDLIERFQDRRFASAEMLIDEGRLGTWKATTRSFPEMGWMGAGLGSYSLVHRMYSPDHETVLFEFAENQFVQSLVDGGLPAALLLILSVGLATYYSVFLLYRGSSALTVATGTLGVYLAGTQLLASVFDYGWYMPANALVLSILVGAVGYQSHALAGRLKKKTPLRFGLPPLLVKGFSLLVFSGTALACVVLYRYWDWNSASLRNVASLEPALLDEAATERHLAEMTDRWKDQSGHRAVESAYLGELWYRRTRLGFYRMLLGITPTAHLSPERRKTVESNLWQLTTLERILEQVRFLGARAGTSFQQELLASPFLTNDLAFAMGYWLDSTRSRPLSTDAQTKLALVNMIMGNDAVAQKLLASTALMAPGSAALHGQAGHALLASGYPDLATERFRELLRLNPAEFWRVVTLIRGFSGRLPAPMDNARIVREVLPDDPQLLYAFAQGDFTDDPGLRDELLNRAMELLADVALSNHTLMVLKANVLLEKGDLESGTDALRAAMTSDPNDKIARYQLAERLLELGRPQEAEEHAGRLLEASPRYSPYVELNKRIQLRLAEEAAGRGR